MDSSQTADPQVDRDAGAGLYVRDVMVASPKTMPADGTIADLRAIFANPRVRTALLVDGERFAGVVHRDVVADSATDDQPARPLARRDVATIEPDAPLAEAESILDAAGDNRLVVLDPDGRTLRGLLCLKSDRSSFCQS